MSNTPWFNLDGLEATCKVVDVYDADTVTVVVPFEKKFYKVKCRLKNIDAAELRTTDEKEKRVAIDGREFLKALILNRTIWIRCGQWGKYGGRMIGELYLTADNMAKNYSINELLVQRKFAYRYDGKKKKKFSEWYIS